MWLQSPWKIFPKLGILNIVPIIEAFFHFFAGKKVEKEKSSWFQRRHLPMSNKTSASSTDVVVTITDEKPRTSILKHTKTIDKSSGVAEVLKKPSILKDKSVDKKDTPKHKVIRV